MTALSGSRLSVFRGGRAILRDVALRFADGEFAAVIGANGAGKSTLLMVLAGLLRPERGDVRLDGRPIARLAPADLARRRAYLPQNPRCEWPISVERLVALGLTPTLPFLGGLAEGDRRRVFEMLAECDLLDRAGQPATTLSGGELARAMLARAMVGNPDILIVDEPIAGLDPKHALETMKRLRELAASGKIVIAAIHDLTLAARHATRIIALDRGRVAEDGHPKAVLTPPLLKRVFEIEACVTAGNGGTYVDFLAPSAPALAAPSRNWSGRDDVLDSASRPAEAVHRPGEPP